MTDNELMAELVGTIKDGFPIYSMPEPNQVRQSYQPKSHGTPSPPFVYIHRISSHRYGFQSSRSMDMLGEQIETETQTIEKVFQIGGEALEETPTLAELTAYDYVENTSIILNSQYARERLKLAGICLLRITDIRNPYFMNERERYQQDPSFDFTVIYTQTRSRIIPSIESIDGTIQGV